MAKAWRVRVESFMVGLSGGRFGEDEVKIGRGCGSFADFKCCDKVRAIMLAVGLNLHNLHPLFSQWKAIPVCCDWG
jgi:hypothetical protein